MRVKRLTIKWASPWDTGGSLHVQGFSLQVVCSRMRKFKQCLSQCLFGTHVRFSVMNWTTVAETH